MTRGGTAAAIAGAALERGAGIDRGAAGIDRKREPILRAEISVSVERLIDVYLETADPRDLQAAAGEALRGAVRGALHLVQEDCIIFACGPDDDQFLYALTERGWYSLPDAYQWWEALGPPSRRPGSDAEPTDCYRPFRGSVCHIGSQPQFPHRFVARAD